MKHYLSVVIIVKDEDKFLDEFIAYYRLLGVDHFYFYDNDSAIPLTQSLEKHKDYVTITPISGRARQMDAYKDYLAKYKKHSRWAAFIDIDEFIVPKTTYRLSDFMRSYELADAVAINWVFFGDGNHQTAPAGLVLENYTLSEIKQNIHIKTIANPQKMIHAADPHFMVLEKDSLYIDAKHNEIKNAFNDNPTIDAIQINHYYCKSVEDYLKKAERGRADNGEKRDVSREFTTELRNLWNSAPDTYAKDKYLSDLKKQMEAVN